MATVPKGDIREGRVVETAGRRVRVRDGEGDRLCFLSGQRAVVADVVRFVDAPGEGGKLVEVVDRSTVLLRRDPKGDEQVIAANLGGLVVVVAAAQPTFSGPLLDRYLVAASAAGLAAQVALNKVDLGVSEEVADAVEDLRRVGVQVHTVSATTGVGLDTLADSLEERGPWALVGHSGVGKTALVAALLPGEDVGPVGSISEYWNQGKHTTARSRLFRLPGGGELVDSPGIRSFTPAGLTPDQAVRHFPGLGEVQCRYRDCLHREGEEGCTAETAISAGLLRSWRRLCVELSEKRGRS